MRTWAATTKRLAGGLALGFALVGVALSLIAGKHAFGAAPAPGRTVAHAFGRPAAVLQRENGSPDAALSHGGASEPVAHSVAIPNGSLRTAFNRAASEFGVPVALLGGSATWRAA